MKSYRTKEISVNIWSWNTLTHSRSQILFLIHLFPCIHYNHIFLKFSYFKTNSMIYLCCVSRKIALNSPLVPKFLHPGTDVSISVKTVKSSFSRKTKLNNLQPVFSSTTLLPFVLRTILTLHFYVVAKAKEYFVI